jgi:hypothetical protein
MFKPDILQLSDLCLAMCFVGAAIRTSGLTTRKTRGRRLTTSSRAHVESSPESSRFVNDSARKTSPPLFVALYKTTFDSSTTSLLGLAPRGSYFLCLRRNQIRSQT